MKLHFNINYAILIVGNESEISLPLSSSSLILIYLLDSLYKIKISLPKMCTDFCRGLYYEYVPVWSDGNNWSDGLLPFATATVNQFELF